MAKTCLLYTSDAADEEDSVDLGGNRELAYDFLLVNNSNLSPISHRYWDTATYWLKLANFSHPPLI